MTERLPTCEEMDALLPDYLDGELDASERYGVESHARSCARCGALLTELAAIARDARALPELTPSRDLWPGIEARIQAPVVSLPATRSSAARPRWRATARLAAAAAALVAATAGVTYLATVRAEREHVRLAGSPPSGAALVVNTAAVLPVERAYDHDIARLQSILDERRSRLDTSTVNVIERNLRIIDAAIAQSRAALEKDPGSGLLNDQLNSALNQKVELLRTAALLPART